MCTADLNDFSLSYSFANLFLSDPRYLSSYFEAQFRPRAARPNEVILLVPNILNPGEMLPVPVTYDQLFHFYMDIFSRAFPETDPTYAQQSLQPPAPPTLRNNCTFFKINFQLLICQKAIEK